MQPILTFLANKSFCILCDQHGFVQALHPKKGPKGIKNRKFARWRLELSGFNFTIHLPGILNTAADAFSRIASISINAQVELVRLRHEQFGHPGTNRLRELVQIVAAYPDYAVISRFGATESDTVNWKHLVCHPGPIPSDTSFTPTEMQSTTVGQPDTS